MPVMMVNERKIVANTRPCVMRLSQKLLKTKRLSSEPTTTAATPSDHVSTVNTWVRSVAAGAGGGGAGPGHRAGASRGGGGVGRDTPGGGRAAKGRDGARAPG